jgi:hypothetical protein
MSDVLQVSVSFVVRFLVPKYIAQAFEMTEIYPMLFLDEYCEVKDEILRIFLVIQSSMLLMMLLSCYKLLLWFLERISVDLMML